MMDVFTDVDLMCDLMEASNKRRVPVYILLDEKNLDYFTEMCSALDIQNSHLGVSTADTESSDAGRPEPTEHSVHTDEPGFTRCKDPLDY